MTETVTAEQKLAMEWLIATVSYPRRKPDRQSAQVIVDLIESQAKRIAELEKFCEVSDANSNEAIGYAEEAVRRLSTPPESSRDAARWRFICHQPEASKDDPDHPWSQMWAKLIDAETSEVEMAAVVDNTMCRVVTDNRALRERIAELEHDQHAFKNFHRLLCERFGYGHDEIDWRRDQVSLMEWIAKRVDVPPPASLVTIARELDASFDLQTMKENVRLEYDAPDDHEYCVNITANQLRALDRAVLETHARAVETGESRG